MDAERGFIEPIVEVLPVIGNPLSERWPLYLGLGWSVVPIKPESKEPHQDLLRDLYGDTRVEHLRLAPALAEEVDWWFLNWPDINLAVFPTSALVIVDIDFLDQLDPTLCTPTASSGREAGGKHLYFQTDKPIPTKRHPWGHVNPAYVVLPGSIHESGLQYEWLPGLSPLEVPFMSFEEALPVLGLDTGES